MTTLLLSGSPHRDQGATGLVLAPFVEGLRDGGAKVETVHVYDLDVRPCLGCLSCWTKTPGVCVHTDDAVAVVAAAAASETLVLAAPVYVDGMPGPFKTLIDRFLPIADPYFERRDGRYRHPSPRSRLARMALVSVCGFPEVETFDPLIAHVRAMCENFNAAFAGAAVRPAAEALPKMKAMGLPLGGLWKALREAGRQLAADGTMQDATLASISRELIPPTMYAAAANKHFKKARE